MEQIHAKLSGHVKSLLIRLDYSNIDILIRIYIYIVVYYNAII